MKDGGSAFPEITSERDENGLKDIYSYGGMSLRDYFAGQALLGSLSSSTLTEYTNKSQAECFAVEAYRIADAMIAQREKDVKEDVKQ